jgi:uncharacterized Tic20 family protein
MNESTPSLNSTPAKPTSPEVWCHVLPLIGFVIPFGNVVAPLVYWLLKREAYPRVAEHGKEVVIFQASVTLYFLLGWVLVAIPFLGWLLAVVILPAMAVAVLAVIYFHIRGILAAQKEAFFVYPFKLPFLAKLLDEHMS